MTLVLSGNERLGLDAALGARFIGLDAAQLETRALQPLAATFGGDRLPLQLAVGKKPARHLH